MRLALIGIKTSSCPVGLNRARPARTKRALPPQEQAWLNLRPFFKTPIKQEGLVTPIGTARTHPLDRFLDRVAELNALIATQEQEIATLRQEFAANGLTATSLSSSSADGDDDETSVEITEGDILPVPLSPDPVELAPVLRRIEWERYAWHCSPVQHIFIARRDDGSPTIRTTSRALTPGDVAAYGPALRAALGDRSLDDLDNDRARAAYYGGVGSLLYGVKTGDHAPEQTADERGADDHYAPDAPDGGPVELGLHEPAFPYEPPPSFYWKDMAPVIVGDPDANEVLSRDEIDAAHDGSAAPRFASEGGGE